MDAAQKNLSLSPSWLELAMDTMKAMTVVLTLNIPSMVTLHSIICHIIIVDNV